MNVYSKKNIYIYIIYIYFTYLKIMCCVIIIHSNDTNKN